MRHTQILIVSLLIVSAFGLTGCNVSTSAQSVYQEQDSFARAYLQLLREGNISRAQELVNPKYVDVNTPTTLGQMTKYFDKGDLVSTEVAGFRSLTTPDMVRVEITYQLHFPRDWILASAVVDTVAGQSTISGFHVQAIPKSLQEINALTFSDKGLTHYIFILIGVLVLIFNLFVLILLLRTKLRFKLLWLLGILVGVGKFSLDWTSGQIDFQPISIYIPVLSAVHWSAYSSWVFSISFPLGAVLFVLLRNRLNQSQPGHSNSDSIAQTVLVKPQQ